jgi:O-antigen/teichoic acid export membrane protein
MRAGAGDFEGAKKTFGGIIWLCCEISIGVILLSITISTLSLNTHVFNTHFISSNEASILIFLFGLGVCLSFFLGTISTGFTCCGKNATGILISNLSRLLETVTIAITLWLKCSPVYVCLTGLIIKLLIGIIQAILLIRTAPWLFKPKVSADQTVVKRLIKPSLAFLAFPAGNALALQAPLLVLGVVFGSTSVAAFSSLRTLARLPIQLTNVFNASIWPEMSKAYGSGDMVLLRKLHHHSWIMNMLLVTTTSIVIAFFGDTIVSLWLHKQNLYNPFILQGLLVVSVFFSIWGASSIVLTAVNSHTKMAIYYLIINSLGCVLSYIFSIYLGIQGFIYTLILVEFLMVLIVLPMAISVSKDSLRNFIISVFNSCSYSFGRLGK